MMKNFLCLMAILFSLLAPAQNFQPHFYAGLSLPKHSYTPSGEIPKRSFNAGFTAGMHLAATLKENERYAFLLGLNYTQKGGTITYKDGRIYETRFNAVAMEYGFTTDHAHASRWNFLNIGLGFTAAYLLDGQQKSTVAGITSTRKLTIGNKAPDDLFQLSFGFKTHLMINIGPHFDLGFCYQGSFNELDLVNKNNLRDKGILFSLGYWIHAAERE
jgi:Outer membrane protein beta-barrel domain